MQLTIKATQNRGFRVVKCKAVIRPSVKLGIPRRFQKTWTVRTVAPEFACEDSRKAFESEAVRWEKKIMDMLAAEALEKKKAKTNLL